MGGRRAVVALVAVPAALGLTVTVAMPAAATDEPAPEVVAAEPSASAVAEPPPAASSAEPDPPAPEPAPTASEPVPTPAPEDTATPPPPTPSPEAPAPSSSPTTEPTTDPAPSTDQAPSPDAPFVPLPQPAPAPALEAYDPDVHGAPTGLGPGPLDPVEFSDVADELGDARFTVFAEDIAWLGGQGIATGAEDGDGGLAFGPQETVTRGAFAAFLYRLAGSPSEDVPATVAFADAGPAQTAFSAEIAWAASLGIATGTEADGVRVFSPDAPLTRGALALMLYRYAGAPEASLDEPYVDTDPDTAAGRAIAWLGSTVADLGWDAEDGREYRAGATVTRDAVAGVLHAAADAGVELAAWEAPLRIVTASHVQVVDADRLNLRTGPSFDDEVATMAVAGDEFDTTGAVTPDGWVQVSTPDGLLWAHRDYLAVDPGASIVTSAGATETSAELSGTYANGSIPATALCALSWHASALLACGAAADLESLDAAFRARFGGHLAISSAYRDLAGQYAARAAHGGMAAVPGTSNHGWGEAIDLALEGLPGGETGEAYRWLVAAAPQYGWALPGWAAPGGSKPEPWHLEHVG